jgi:hypothetical protein
VGPFSFWALGLPEILWWGLWCTHLGFGGVLITTDETLVISAHAQNTNGDCLRILREKAKHDSRSTSYLDNSVRWTEQKDSDINPLHELAQHVT